MQSRLVASTLLCACAMQPRTHGPRSQQVAIVSANIETLDGLETYLRSAGVAARGSERLEDCADLTGAATVAVVLFPDDFAWETVRATLEALAARRPKVLRVLVTGQPKKLDALLEAHPNVLVVPRPVWGWTILDAIRARLDGDGDGDGPGSGSV